MPHPESPLHVPLAPAPPLRLDISTYRWTAETGPEAWGELSRNESALLVRLCAREYPLVANTSRDEGTVWQDSCLELFLCPEGGEEYLNFEVNPLGAMIIGLGAGRENRRSRIGLKEHIGLEIGIRPVEGLWQAEWRLPFPLLEEVFGAAQGPRIRCNLYKCGGIDSHYGMWRDTGTKAPDFHRPESFGTLAL